MQAMVITKRQRLGWIAVCAVIFFAGVLVGFSIAQQEGVAIDRGQTVSMMIDDGVRKIETFVDIAPLANETLFALTRRIAQEKSIPFSYKEYAGLGPLITQIGPPLDTAGGASWQYWINNRYGQVGADGYTVQPGDVIVWKFTASKQ